MADAPAVLPPADTALVVVTDKSGEFVLLTRESDGSVWFPGGKLEPGETPVDAAVRELEEETGLKLDTSDLVLVSSLSRTATHGQHHNFMMKPDLQLDLHILKSSIISRTSAGMIVTANENAATVDDPIGNQIMIKPFAMPIVWADYDNDPNKEPAEKIQYGVFAKWDIFNKVVVPDGIGQLVIDDLGHLGAPVNVRFHRNSNFHYLAKKVTERVTQFRMETSSHRLANMNMAADDETQIAFSPALAKIMPKATLFSELSGEDGLVQWLETTRQQLQACGITLNSAEAVHNTTNLITETCIANWIRAEKSKSPGILPWATFDDFEKAILENYVAHDLGSHYKDRLEKELTQDTKIIQSE